MCPRQGKEWSKGLSFHGVLKYTDTYSKSVATTLRLVEPWMGSGRCVVGDSWFGNVGCAAALIDNGLACVFAIKTAHRFFPAEGLTALLNDRCGDHVTATATFKGQKVHALKGTVTHLLDQSAQLHGGSVAKAQQLQAP